MSIRYNLRQIEEEKNCKFIEEENYVIKPLLDNPIVNNDLFAFLIENNMNRYIFAYLLKVDDLNLDKIPFCDNLLNENKLKEICGESFIKKFVCRECGKLLFRKHLHEINYNDNFSRECQICGKYNNVLYSDLEDEFNITRYDLIKFMDKLVELSVFSKELVASCNYCTEYNIVNSENFNSFSCPSCGNLMEIKFKYTSNFDFLISNPGFWFEWYVYNLCKNIFPRVHPNYGGEYLLDNQKIKCDFDILIFDDDKVIVYECKDYMKVSKNRLSMKDFIDNISKIRHFADKIYIVSSIKPFKDNSIIETEELFNPDVKFIEGMELEDKFLNEDNIITFFEKRNYNIVYLFKKLPVRKQEIILSKIFNLMIENDNSIYIEILNNIFMRVDIDNIHVSDEILIDSLNVALSNVYNNKFIVLSLNYIKNLFFYNSSVFQDFDLNKFIEFCTPFLTSHPLQGYEKRAPFYYFIAAYFKKGLADINSLDDDVAKSFLLKLIPMIEIYYGSSSVVDTLNIFYCLWDYMDSDLEVKFIDEIIEQYEDHSSKRYAISNFIEKIKINLSTESIVSLKKIFPSI